MRSSTVAIHGDADLAQSYTKDVAPPISVSSTFIRSDGSKIGGSNGNTTTKHVYSRESSDTRDRVESVIAKLESNDAHAVLYSSGVTALYALCIAFQPKRVVMTKDGYHGSHSAVNLYLKTKSSSSVVWLEDTPVTDFKPNDLIILESPRNPTGEVYDIPYYASHKPTNALLVVDATFLPPPLQQCLLLGADVVMHSATKFLGGHSDLVSGCLVTRSKALHEQLIKERTIMGCIPGNLETWLLLRSLRSLVVRVQKQSETAVKLVAWLNNLIRSNNNIVKKVYHASIPGTKDYETTQKMRIGYSAVFAIELSTAEYAQHLPTALKLFTNATSLGGCETLIDWRYRVDPKISPGLLRISVGLEDFEDLKADLEQGLLKVVSFKSSNSKDSKL